MTENETRKAQAKVSKAEFKAWLRKKFFEISGRFVPPVNEELDQLSDEVYKKLK
jgi:hypothetical protein